MSGTLKVPPRTFNNLYSKSGSFEGLWSSAGCVKFLQVGGDTFPALNLWRARLQTGDTETLRARYLAAFWTRSEMGQGKKTWPAGVQWWLDKELNKHRDGLWSANPSDDGGGVGEARCFPEEKHTHNTTLSWWLATELPNKGQTSRCNKLGPNTRLCASATRRAQII